MVSAGPMMRARSPGLLRLAPAFVAATALLACRGDDPPATAATSTSSASSSASGSGGAGGSGGNGGAGGMPNKAAGCVDSFGNALTSAFGRLDGTTVAVVKPTDQQCTGVNNDHVVLEVMMNGAVYRLVVNIQSTFGDPNVDYLAIDHALPPPAWAEGWHTGIAVDYVATFGVHSPDFKPYPLAQLADVVADAIPIGEKVSVYALSSGGGSAHEVHRNKGTTDGAIVLDLEGTSPKVLLFHFADQTF
jgi:hypothetical protein